MARNNECIEERKDSYRVHIPYYDELGIRRFYSKSFSIKKYGTKQRALEFAKKHRDEIKVKLSNKMVIKTTKASMREVFDEMMDHFHCSLNTRRKYESVYQYYIKSIVDENRQFESIKFTDIQSTLNKMVKNSTDDYIQRVFSVWKKMYKHALASDIVLRDETIKVEVPKSEKIVIKRKMETTYQDMMDQIQRIQDSVRSNRESILYKNALLVMYYTGMRPSEVFALETENIDLENNMIYVCQKIGSNSTEDNVITKTKTSDSNRYVPISLELIPVFKELISVSKDGFLFKKDNGLFINGSEFSNLMNRLSKGTFRAYTLRHQLATDLHNDGVNIRTIQEIMGHKNSSMTISYARSNDELKINAINNRKKDSIDNIVFSEKA